MVELLLEYDRSKRDLKCKACDRFYKRLDDAVAEDAKNITQITAHKARVKVSDWIQKEYEDSLKDDIKSTEVVKESVLKSFATKSVAAVVEMVKPRQPKIEDTPIVEPIAEAPAKPPGLWKRFKSFVVKLFKR